MKKVGEVLNCSDYLFLERLTNNRVFIIEDTEFNAVGGSLKVEVLNEHRPLDQIKSTIDHTLIKEEESLKEQEAKVQRLNKIKERIDKEVSLDQEVS